MVAEDGVQFPLHDNERPEIGISAFWKQQHGLGTGAGQFQILRRASSVLSLLDVLIRAANPQVDQLITLERGDHYAARDKQPCLVLAVPLLRRKPEDGTRPEPSGLAVLASKIAEAVRPDDLFRNAALRQPVERLGMIPDFGLGFGQQLRRVVSPLLRRRFLGERLPCRPCQRFHWSGTATGTCRYVRDAQFGAGFAEAHAFHLRHVQDAVPGLATPAAREHARDMVFHAGMAKVPFPVGPDHEAVGLAVFPSTKWTRAIPAISLLFYSLTIAVTVEFQHRAHSDLSKKSYWLFLYLFVLFIFLSFWTDGQIL